MGNWAYSYGCIPHKIVAYVGEIYEELLLPDKIFMSRKLRDSLRQLFQIWGWSYVGMLRSKFTRWVEAFVIDQRATFSRRISLTLPSKISLNGGEF